MNRLLFVPLCLVLPVLLGAAPPRSTIALSHVTLIDCTAPAPRKDQTVVVRDGRIAAIDASGKANVPADAKVIDGKGRFLIPGLWDMHVHLLWEPAIDTLFPLCIANGVTGVRDMHTHVPFVRVHRWRREVQEGERVGPRFVYAGPILDGTPPIWPGSIAVATPEAAREAVRQVKSGGASHVKVYERLSREAYFAVAAEAKHQSIPLVGHVPAAVTPAEASDAGQRSIEHLSHLLEHCSVGRDGPFVYDPIKGKALFERFKTNQTWQCPTLIVAVTSTFGREDRIANDPRRKYLTPTILSRVGFDDSKRDWDATLRFWREERKLMKDLRASGVGLLLAGTDTPIVRNVPGFTLHDELGELVEVGLTPAEALQAATRNAARFLGIEDQFGTIEVGKAADLVLLDADPMVNIRNTTRIELVVADGRPYDRAELDRMLSDIEAAARAEATTRPTK